MKGPNRTGLGELLLQLVMSERKRFLAIASELDLPWAQAMMLWRVGEHPDGLPMSAVADHFGCDPSNVTAVTDKLEALELLRRTASPDDRRVKLLVLTDGGRRIVKKLTERLFETPDWARALPAADQKKLREILERAVTD